VTIIDIGLICLATLYLAVILSDDRISGPLNVLTRIRRKAGVKYDDTNFPTYLSGSLADMIMCPYCNSLWIGIAIAIPYGLFLAAGGPARWLLAPLAAGGFVVLVQELKNG